MPDLLKEWWSFVFFVGTGVVGWLLGVEKNRWKINDLGEAMIRLERRVGVLESQGSEEKATLAAISVTLMAISATLVRLENRIDGKQDK